MASRTRIEREVSEKLERGHNITVEELHGKIRVERRENELLQAEIEKLRQALQRIVDDWPHLSEYSLNEAVKALKSINE